MQFAKNAKIMHLENFGAIYMVNCTSNSRKGTVFFTPTSVGLTAIEGGW